MAGDGRFSQERTLELFLARGANIAINRLSCIATRSWTVAIVISS
jgi:hypothetical protein